MLKKLSFQKKLFLGLSIIIILLIFILSSAFYKYSTSVTRATEYRTSQQIVEKMSDQIDELYQQMDIAATSIVYNEQIQNIIYELNFNKEIDSNTLLEYDAIVRKNLQTINFYLRKVIKTAIFNSEKNFYYYTGLLDDDPETVTKRLSDVSWYKSLVDPEELMQIVPPHQNCWSRKPKPVLSLYRKFGNPYGSSFFGIFEIQMPYSVLEDICKMDSLPGESQILLFDEKGELVFPYNSKDYKFVYINPQKIFDATKGTTNGLGQLKTKRDNIMFSFYRSDYTKFTVVLASKQSILEKQLSFYRNLTIIFAVIIMLVILTAFYLLISGLTRPLKALISTVEDVSLENLSLEVPHEGQNEFIMLNESFNSMFSKLKDSINKLYESKIRETNAHLLALQAQMNPHFLYNTLSVISASSEEQGDFSAARMCNQLSAMMRYIVSSSNSVVTLKDEIIHTTNYLDLMKTHYEEYLHYEVDIPEEMNNILIPKITLQPLVENSINHGFENIQPPWDLRIKGQLFENGDWEITIKDNGAGFEQDALLKLTSQLQEYKINLKAGNFKENLSIGGMGVLNTYARFSIHFKENAVFKIENCSPHGCIVTLGYKTVKQGVEAQK